MSIKYHGGPRRLANTSALCSIFRVGIILALTGTDVQLAAVLSRHVRRRLSARVYVNPATGA